MEYVDRNKNQLLHLSIFIFFILASVSFMTVFSPSITDYLQLGTLGLVLVIIILHYVYIKEKPYFTKNFNIPITLILFSVILSMISANYFHGQSFAITAVVQRPIYFYMMYYALHYFSFKPNTVIKVMFGIAFFYVFVYLVQYIIYPTVILHCRVIMDRNTVRIYMPGSAYAVFVFIFSLHIFFQKHQFKYIFICLLMFLIFIFGGSRQVLVSVFLTTALYLILTKRIKNKFVVVFVAILGLIPFYLLLQDMLLALIDVTKSQSANIESNPRVGALRFYLLEFSSNKLTYIFGNGAPSLNSAYGRLILRLAISKGFNLSDIGMLGEFFKYGFLFVAVQLFVIFKLIFTKLPDAIIPIRFIFIIILMTMFTGAGAFGYADNIVFLCIIFYLLDVAKDKKMSESEVNEMFTI